MLPVLILCVELADILRQRVCLLLPCLDVEHSKQLFLSWRLFMNPLLDFMTGLSPSPVSLLSGAVSVSESPELTSPLNEFKQYLLYNVYYFFFFLQLVLQFWKKCRVQFKMLMWRERRLIPWDIYLKSSRERSEIDTITWQIKIKIFIPNLVIWSCKLSYNNNMEFKTVKIVRLILPNILQKKTQIKKDKTFKEYWIQNKICRVYVQIYKFVKVW